MYFKNSFGKIYLENGKLYVDTEVCTITVDPKDDDTREKFLKEEFDSQVERLQMAEMVLPPKK
ncbi:hypothetical protein [Enterococcus sp. AZ196]|uniref:hypothetical protein n=1 Tax=Enterococcus sp. AZ196 TaxID=2774659 RepID=UPI003D297747